MLYYKQFLTISLIVMSLTIMSSIVYASLPEHIQSPRQQIESGIMPNEITCRDDLIRVMRNNGDVACVSEFYAKKLGWSQIPNIPHQLIIYVDEHALIDHENNNFITVKYEDTRDPGILYSPSFLAKPYSTVTYPEKIHFGVPFNITISWQFFKINEVGEIDLVKLFPFDYHPETELTILTYSPVEFLNPGYTLSIYDNYMKIISTHKNVYQYNETRIFSESLTFNVSKLATMPERDQISILLSESSYQIYIKKIENGTILSTDPPPSYPHILPASSTGNLIFGSENRPSASDTIPFDQWDRIYALIKKEFPDKSVYEVLHQSNYNETFIEEFLKYHQP